MRYAACRLFLLSVAVLFSAVSFGRDLSPLAVRGLHLSAPRPGEVADCLRFVREACPKEGVNVLVMEFGYNYQFKKRGRGAWFCGRQDH